MFGALVKKIFGTVNDRVLKTISPMVDEINAYEEQLTTLSDEQLKAKTAQFKERLANGENLDDILTEAFAVVREGSVRSMGMRHFDVQMLGGIVLHQGQIAEMRTGEGKTLVATLAVYLNALEGKGVHVVTVNDYLARRDSEWMGTLYNFLGLEVSCIIAGLDDEERKQAYAADITYGTNNEFGFDYLRDNMKFSRDQMVQRPFNYAIVDEVDSILIDEARTPLVISGPTEDNSELYTQVDKLIPKLEEVHYEIDEKAKSVSLTEEGNEFAEKLLKDAKLLEEGSSMYDIGSISIVHHVNQALRAHKLFSNETDYIVKDGSVVIIDEFTGRMMDGRRYSDGLHQALEAKENVTIQNENQTLASITFQNYFRAYPKLAGMTGTAMTEQAEFSDIYKLEVVAMPPNLTVSRIDEDDDIFRTRDEKFKAIIETIVECYGKKQPVLVGTASIEQSEFLAKLLKKQKIPHNVLNAKHHAKEAQIISLAGLPGAVTIATNMAGRGTDIKLGGNEDIMLEEALVSSKKKLDIKELAANIKKEVEANKEKVIAAGGLFVLGTERHESRRIDNQLRGRSGRQGDPGVSKFFLSMEDDLMRIFGSEKMSNMLQKLGMKEGESITHPWISGAIENAQKRVEQHNFDIRKNLLKFDDVMNDQRKVIYDQRVELMDTDDVSDTVKGMYDEITENMVNVHVPAKSYVDQWDVEGLGKEFYRIYGVNPDIKSWSQEEGVAEEEILKRLDNEVDQLFAKKETKYGAELMRLAEKKVLLLTLDQLWKDHLLSLDHLKQGIGLRAYGQKDPLNEYKREAFELFETMLSNLNEVVTGRLAHMELDSEVGDSSNLELGANRPVRQLTEGRMDPAMAAAQRRSQSGGTVSLGPVKTRVKSEDRDPNDPSTWGKVSRNEDCPCGSGKKYKHCHGKIA